MIRLSSLRRALKSCAPRTSHAAVTAIIGVASVTAALAVATPPAQAAAAPHAISFQSGAAAHTVSPAALVWKKVATFDTEDQCEAVGLAEYESGEALDYRCVPTTTCPVRYILELAYKATPAVAALPARPAAVQPAC